MNLDIVWERIALSTNVHKRVLSSKEITMFLRPLCAIARLAGFLAPNNPPPPAQVPPPSPREAPRPRLQQITGVAIWIQNGPQILAEVYAGWETPDKGPRFYDLTLCAPSTHIREDGWVDAVEMLHQVPGMGRMVSGRGQVQIMDMLQPNTPSTIAAEIRQRLDRGKVFFKVQAFQTS